MRVEGVMGTIYANDPDHHGSAYFDVVNLRSSGEYKVLATEQSLMYTVTCPYYLPNKNNKRRFQDLYFVLEVLFYTFSRRRLDLLDLLDFTKTFFIHFTSLSSFRTLEDKFD